MTLPERYPNADILAQRRHWDDATRRVVLDRVHNTPEFHFFDEHQRATLEALCARVIPQSHRPADRRVPLARWIDARCAGHHSEGFRFDDMPPNEQAWTWGLQGLDETTRALFAETHVPEVDPRPQENDADPNRFGNPPGDGTCFCRLEESRQHQVLDCIRAGDPPGEIWQRMPANRWWVFVALRQTTAAYYAHPYAWDEIGFGGPAYPRGYFALNFGYPEPWEPREVGEQAGRSLRPRWRFP